MVLKELKTNFSAKAFASVIFAALSYCYAAMRLGNLQEFLELIKTGLPQARKEVLTLSFLQKVPFLPVFFVWFFIGAILYFLYFSLSLVYSDLANRIIVKTSFANTKSGQEEIEISKIKRLFFHTLVVFYYLVAGIITFFFTLPFSEKVRLFGENIARIYMKANYAFFISFIGSFLFWLFMLNLFALFLGVLFSFIIKEELKEEHFAIKTE
jgi:hypothetical protein